MKPRALGCRAWDFVLIDAHLNSHRIGYPTIGEAWGQSRRAPGRTATFILAALGVDVQDAAFEGLLEQAASEDKKGVRRSAARHAERKQPSVPTLGFRARREMSPVRDE